MRLRRIEREYPRMEPKQFTVEADTDEEAADKFLSHLLDSNLAPGERYAVTYRIAGQERTCAYTHVSHDDWVLANAEERRK
jgi:hypothetical protein